MSYIIYTDMQLFSAKFNQSTFLCNAYVKVHLCYTSDNLCKLLIINRSIQIDYTLYELIGAHLDKVDQKNTVNVQF